MTSPITPSQVQVVYTPPLLPGVPTPRPLLPGVPTPRPLLPGVSTPFFHEAVTKAIADKGHEFYSLLATLDRCLHPPQRVKGLIGGPGLVHPNSCRSALKELQAYFKRTASNNSQDQKVLERLKKIANEFIPIYEEYIGRGIHYPSSQNPTLRYVDSRGQEISKEQFDHISRKYEVALANAISSL